MATMTSTAIPAPATIRYEKSTGPLAAAITVPLVLAAILLITALFLIRENERRRNAEQLLQRWTSGDIGANAGRTTASTRKPWS